METSQKQQAYALAKAEIRSVLADEQLLYLKMSTINCILKKYLPYCYWVGFYLVHQGALAVGPYQGSLGCLHIPFSKGVCGRAARTQTVQIVADTHSDPEHIACDAASLSEIVLPVFNPEKQLIAVLDVDSLELGSFDQTDALELAGILEEHFSRGTLLYGCEF